MRDVVFAALALTLWLQSGAAFAQKTDLSGEVIARVQRALASQGFTKVQVEFRGTVSEGRSVTVYYSLSNGDSIFKVQCVTLDQGGSYCSGEGISTIIK